ncbi:MAG: choice-of-anchor Q domain-containing protein [Candidatus Binatia bacterium]
MKGTSGASRRLLPPNRRMWVLGACILCASASARATQYNVPGDFSTIQAALDATVAGDTVTVQPGTYFEKLSFPTSGDATGGFITLRGAAGTPPVLDGTGVPGRNMMLVSSKSYVKIIGFEIRNNLGVNDGSGIRVVGAGSHIEIRNNRIHDIRGKDAMGITVYGTEPAPISDLVIDGNEIFDCEPFRSEALTLNGNVTQFQVTNNIVRDVNNIGIDCIGGETDIQPDQTKVCREGVIRGNQVYRANEKGGGFAGAIYVDGGRDVVVEGNTTSESDLGLEVGAENAGIVASGVIVRDNVIFRNTKVCIVFGGFDASVGRVKGSSFLNNTCYQNDTLRTGIGELWIQYAEDNTVRNNIFYSTSQNVLLYSDAGNVNNALDYNLWFTEAGASSATFVWRGTEYGSYDSYRTSAGQDAHSVFGNPQFTSPATADFHLGAGSPAVNAGDPAFTAAVGETDLDGAPRLSGGRVDIGADEITCGDGVLAAGELCDDGNLVDCDGCDSDCRPSRTCGNGIVCAPEQCDDGNTSGADCCSPTCSADQIGAACDDHDLCTGADACDGSGTCVGTASPASVCRQPTSSRRSRLLLKDKNPDRRDLVLWKWTKGEETQLPDLGDPRTDTDYALCVYDQSAATQPLLRIPVPAASLCSGHPCWKATGTGYRYRDRSGAAAGVRSLLLQAAESGRAKVVLRAKGSAVPLPTLQLTPPVTVQLRNGAGACWGATYTTPRTNQADRFDARSD